MQQRIDFGVLESEHDSDVKSLSSRADGADAPGLTTKAEEEGLACSSHNGSCTCHAGEAMVFLVSLLLGSLRGILLILDLFTRCVELVLEGLRNTVLGLVCFLVCFLACSGFFDGLGHHL